MAVSERDVRHVAALARIGLDEARVPALVAELNGILVHMDVLQRVRTHGDAAVEGVGAGGMPLREDAGPQYPLAHPRVDFAPEMRDGFFLVPRLATHTGLKTAAEVQEASVDDPDAVELGDDEGIA